MRTRQYAKDLCTAALDCLKLDAQSAGSSPRPATHLFMPVAKFGERLASLNLATYRKYWAVPKN